MKICPYQSTLNPSGDNVLFMEYPIAGNCLLFREVSQLSCHPLPPLPPSFFLLYFN